MGKQRGEPSFGMVERIAEQCEPGPVGELETGPPDREPRSRWVRLVRGVIALVMVAAPLVIAVLHSWSVLEVAALAFGGAVYLLIAYYALPRPDWSNMGWMGGALDNPFRLSDDANRFLLFLSVVLFPGRFASTALIDLLRRAPPPGA